MTSARHLTAGARPVTVAAALATGALAAGAAVGVHVGTDSLALAAAAAGASAAIAMAVLVPRWVLSRALRPALIRAEEVAGLERKLEVERNDRAALRELANALDRAEDEHQALEVMRHALSRHFPGRPIEVHLLDANEPVLAVEIAVNRPDDVIGQRSSPWEPIATRTGATQVYESTERTDACAHVRTRAGRPSSAVAVPLNATGRILGVVYAFGPDGEQPDGAEVILLEDFASSFGARLAYLRTSAAEIRRDSIDTLTGLPDRSAMQDQLTKLLYDRIPFSVAIADIDHLENVNRQYGRAVGDSVLGMMAKLARRGIRPDDLVGRVGGDELLFIFPNTRPKDSARAIERIREEMIVTQSVDDSNPTITISVGLVGSTAGVTIDVILRTAAAALKSAQNAGGNRIVVAQPVTEQPKT